MDIGIHKLGMLLALAAPVAFAQPQNRFDANGVTLGASEKAVLTAYPAAYCKPLEWRTSAADRRCDEAKAVLGGMEVRVTFYLKADRVQAFDVRFDAKDSERAMDYLKKRYGKPSGQSRDAIPDRHNPKIVNVTRKLRWDHGRDHAVFVAAMEKRRVSLMVSRGDFENEIYRIR